MVNSWMRQRRPFNLLRSYMLGVFALLRFVLLSIILLGCAHELHLVSEVPDSELGIILFSNLLQIFFKLHSILRLLYCPGRYFGLEITFELSWQVNGLRAILLVLDVAQDLVVLFRPYIVILPLLLVTVRIDKSSLVEHWCFLRCSNPILRVESIFELTTFRNGHLFLDFVHAQLEIFQLAFLKVDIVLIYYLLQLLQVSWLLWRINLSQAGMVRLKSVVSKRRGDISF